MQARKPDMAQCLPDGWDGDILDFWFRGHGRQSWFKRDGAFDAAIRARFLPLYESLALDLPTAAFDQPRSALAAILALDQFPRNLFRGSPRAFATDAPALHLSQNAVGRGHDAALNVDERLFLYLPFEHSERAGDQQRAVSLISELGDAEYTRFALAHQDIITRYGRFPHRNEALGRPSTQHELAFLKLPGSSF